MLEFIFRFLFTIAFFGLFIFLLSIGAMLALAGLVVTAVIMLYLYLCRKGVVRPPGMWRMPNSTRVKEKIIEVEYEVIGDDKKREEP